MFVLSKLRENERDRQLEGQLHSRYSPLKLGKITAPGPIFTVATQGGTVQAESWGGSFGLGETVKVIVPDLGLAVIKRLEAR